MALLRSKRGNPAAIGLPVHSMLSQLLREPAASIGPWYQTLPPFVPYPRSLTVVAGYVRDFRPTGAALENPF